MTTTKAASRGAMALVLMLGVPVVAAEAGVRYEDASLPVPAGSIQAGTTGRGEAVTVVVRGQPGASTAGFSGRPSGLMPKVAGGRTAADPSMPLEAALPDEAAQAGSGRADRDAQATAAAQTARRGGQPYADHIARHARSAGVPVELAMAVVRIESNHDPRARGRAGEIGLMQIKPQTARGLGFSGPAAALYDPDTNLKWGMKYLAGAYRLAGGDTCGTILRYQAGHGARRMTAAASAYCGKVKRHMAGQRV
ncbi:transglycosylase-like protein with SLT domain [Tepidamorphus gemmatus]|uniref:Transglycosylase-like protein with SLT domain n=1 Tax=Tepidamorphus gemmatus TaxID=747076 RepID=A0A4R3MIM2_9HYPH|nr:transglycosylase SLT domain-containing protein [Tepidamorphus gemmatus]TCT13492.1 transglycosylase-like protein with SLT domain [Tepidamorphus gemmatus]